MKPVNVDQIALGACNFAIASAQAGSSRLSAVSADVGVRHLINSLAKKNVTVHSDDVEEAFSKVMHDLLPEKVLGTIQEAEQAIADAKLPPKFHDKLDRVKDAIAGEKRNLDTAAALLLEVVYDLIAELSEPLFLRVETDKRELYEQQEPPFGSAVESKFPQSARDVAAAARCLALDEWTATVFHLMRALEQPLHKLADKVGSVFPKAIEFENWKSIVDKLDSDIEAEVKRLEQQKASHQRNDELKVYGAIALQFRHFKNAWRNSAAHGRESYDEREATIVFEGVKTFMQAVAAIA